MTYPISEIKTVLHIIYLVLFHHNYSAAPSQKSQLRTPSSPNHIRKRISQRAPDDYEKFLFVLWRWNSRKRGALWRTRFLLLRRFIGMLSTRKPGIIVRSPLNITLPNRSHKKRRHRVSSMSSHNFYSSYCSSALAIAIWKSFWSVKISFLYGFFSVSYTHLTLPTNSRV